MSATLSSEVSSNARRNRAARAGNEIAGNPRSPAVSGCVLELSRLCAAPMMEMTMQEIIGDRRAPGLKARVKRFYVDNPDEELSHALLREKFTCSKWTAVWILRELIEEGFLESVHVIRLRTKGIAKEKV